MLPSTIKVVHRLSTTIPQTGLSVKKFNRTPTSGLSAGFWRRSFGRSKGIRRCSRDTARSSRSERQRESPSEGKSRLGPPPLSEGIRLPCVWLPGLASCRPRIAGTSGCLVASVAGLVAGLVAALGADDPWRKSAGPALHGHEKNPPRHGGRDGHHEPKERSIGGAFAPAGAKSQAVNSHSSRIAS